MVTIFKNSKYINNRMGKKPELMTNYIIKCYYLPKTTVSCNNGDLARAYEEDKTVNKIIFLTIREAN